MLNTEIEIQHINGKVSVIFTGIVHEKWMDTFDDDFANVNFKFKIYEMKDPENGKVEARFVFTNG